MDCKHTRIAKIDKFYRCRDCGQLFDEMPKVATKTEDKPVEAEAPAKKAPAKKPAARKGAK